MTTFGLIMLAIFACLVYARASQSVKSLKTTLLGLTIGLLLGSTVKEFVVKTSSKAVINKEYVSNATQPVAATFAFVGDVVPTNSHTGVVSQQQLLSDNTRDTYLFKPTCNKSYNEVSTHGNGLSPPIGENTS